MTVRTIAIFCILVVVFETAVAIGMTLVAQQTGTRGLAWVSILAWVSLFVLLSIAFKHIPKHMAALLFLPTAFVSCAAYFVLGLYLFQWPGFQK